MKKQMLTLCLGLSLALPAFTANDESSDLLEDLSGLELESSEGLQAEMDIEELMHPSPKKSIKGEKPKRGKNHHRNRRGRHFGKYRKASMHSLILCKKAGLKGEQKLELAYALKQHAKDVKPLKEELKAARKAYREVVGTPNANSSLIKEVAAALGSATGAIVAADKSFAGVAAGSLFAEDKVMLGLSCVNSKLKLQNMGPKKYKLHKRKRGHGSKKKKVESVMAE